MKINTESKFLNKLEFKTFEITHEVCIPLVGDGLSYQDHGEVEFDEGDVFFMINNKFYVKKGQGFGYDEICDTLYQLKLDIKFVEGNKFIFKETKNILGK